MCAYKIVSIETTPKFLLSTYDNVEFIADGGYGSVYKCTWTGTITAVKILHNLNPEAQKRFHSEIEILKRLDHPHIVKILDSGETEGYHWYESEFAENGHFGQMQGYLFYSDLDRVDYFRQICLGVKALHDSAPPVIHRDLKPENILAFEYSLPEKHTILKIADFGLATIVCDNFTKTGGALGSADYIAPERVNDPRIKTPASDIYSLGITFLSACTGRSRPSAQNLNLVPEVLKPLIEKMIKEYPRERYQSITEIIEAFDSLSYWRLLTGREPQENEQSTFTAHANIGRIVENAIESLYEANSDNFFKRWEDLEREIDRLGDARDHQAWALKSIPPNVLAMIEKSNPEELRRLVQRFINAADCTKNEDFFSPEPHTWSRFLANTFDISSSRPTKHLCLEWLVKFLVRFKTQGTKKYLYQTIQKIDDPDYTEFLAARLREVGYEEVAKTLDGVPEQRLLDVQSLQTALINIV